MSTTNFLTLKNKVISLFNQRLEASVFEDDKLIGKIWKDNSQRGKWNYSLEENPLKNSFVLGVVLWVSGVQK